MKANEFLIICQLVFWVFLLVGLTTLFTLHNMSIDRRNNDLIEGANQLLRGTTHTRHTLITWPPSPELQRCSVELTQILVDDPSGEPSVTSGIRSHHHVGFNRPLAPSGATSVSTTSLTRPQSWQPSLSDAMQTAFKAGFGDNPTGAPFSWWTDKQIL